MAAACVAAGVWWWLRDDDEGQVEAGGMLGEIGDAMTKATLAVWVPPAAAAPYIDLIRSVEDANGIPRNMLARLLWQESRFRQEIIDGRVKSSAGALGIAQFMPATARELGINPLKPAEAIPAAGRYLAGLYRRFGSWAEALAAYNWGQGNVARKGLAAAPLETRNYFGSILADLGLS